MKRSSLKQDPEKTREWQERSRAAAAKRSRRARKPLASRGEDTLPQVRFRAPSPARREQCARCSRPDRPRRADGWHHFLPQSQIRVYVRGLRLSDETSRALLRKLLSDRRNLIALCADCHASHEARSRPLSGEEVPYSARVFALELGTEWAERLRRMYVGGLREAA